MTATFTAQDWERLSGHDKKALRTLSRIGASLGFEPIAKASGVGEGSITSLMAQGLIEEGEPGIHGRYFKTTDKGSLAIEWCNGNRMERVPD